MSNEASSTNAAISEIKAFKPRGDIKKYIMKEAARKFKLYKEMRPDVQKTCVLCDEEEENWDANISQ